MCVWYFNCLLTVYIFIWTPGRMVVAKVTAIYINRYIYRAKRPNICRLLLQNVWDCSAFLCYVSMNWITLDILRSFPNKTTDRLIRTLIEGSIIKIILAVPALSEHGVGITAAVVVLQRCSPAGSRSYQFVKWTEFSWSPSCQSLPR